ncbi:PREDICTED: TATA box-binding protein-associated factor RNA polymerase I subunit D [Dipodomys ordii]|uniref:TATA box-binding protein-associated factor RNA polymerase I subunit D n=1 Tax=Dipodomys ordii TaxID=10020 RepID=A0A1S3G7Q4_DIPOR|nr:PREDICTED: TATA box-binding protein-associated factor RNA polymerase I subunit D [Dipodomys ordii]XP_012884294.1 PREDICTED: TATA box-binding protein-associated factor RNA polymerase I subunit D [Dipodomys ordii]XP_012884295.1 PREDICTED: TATA box-binding protein-associated factor RNA polymerase I subunit D [Dipodomys ordii]
MDSADCMSSDRAMEIENESEDSSSGSSLFKTQCVPFSPKRRQKTGFIRKSIPTQSFESVETDSSSDSSIEPRPLTLKAIFERFKQKKRKRKKKKYKRKLGPRGRPKGRRSTRRSHIDKKQIKDKGSRFPFLQTESGKKTLPWRKILTFEQAVARGFFNHIEKLKYEHHLKESLKQMNVGEDLEKEDLDSRRYKYLDDDGSISPIEELGEEETAHLEHDCDIQMVEHSCFIISSKFPKKRKADLEQENNEVALSKKRTSKNTKRVKRTDWPEKEASILRN